MMRLAMVTGVALFGLAISAGVASAHTAVLSAGCTGAQFNWTSFAGGPNTVHYSVKVDGGAATTGTVSIGTSGSKTVPLNLNGAHTIVLNTYWLAGETSDRNSNNISKTVTVTCDGTLKVTKRLSPSTDSGRFTIGASGPSTISATNVGDGGTTGAVHVKQGSYTVGESAANSATSLSSYSAAISCSDTAHAGATKSGTGTSLSGVQVDPGDTWECTITNTRKAPAITVVKSGPATAYSGDTLTFTFKVTNTGNLPLANIHVSDDHCTNVTQADHLGDPSLDVGETWTYTCSTVATHTLGQANPVVNTVTATGTPPGDSTPVTDTDTHSTLFLHPGISIDKSGPATAPAGQPVGYSLDVVNTGDMPFAAERVTLTDAKCDAPPALVSVNGDTSPGSLDPGERWTYSCRVQTTTSDTEVVNTGSVTGTDANGHQVTAQDTATTQLIAPEAPATAAAPQQAVSPATISSGTARLRGPVGCARAATVSAAVTGRRIVKVTYTLDGKRVRTVTKPDKAGRWTLSIKTAGVRRGEHRIVARVQFSTQSATATRVLRLSFVRCKPAVVRPEFTG